MNWLKGAILLTLFALGSTQRGGRRYVPDQPLEESLSVDNHRFTSRRKDESGGIRRGDNQRTTTEDSTNIRQIAPRSRGRTDNPRQFHSIPAEETFTRTTESNQFLPRRNHVPERRKFTSREGVYPEMIRAREQEGSSETPHNRHWGHGRSRSESKIASENRRGTAPTKFPSRVNEDTESQSANHEPVRNRADGRRGRVESHNRSQVPRRNSLQDETRSLQRPTTPHFPTERIKTRSRFASDDIRQIVRTTENHQVNSEKQGPASSVESSLNHLEIGENESSEKIDTENKIEDIVTQKDPGIIENVLIKENNGAEDTESTLKFVPVSTESSIEYPTRLNDVEESRRASRKLETQATEKSTLRGRNRSADSKRILDTSIKLHDDGPENVSGRTRNSETRSRGRSQNTFSSRGSNSDNSIRSRNYVDSSRTNNSGASPARRREDHTSRSRDSEENNRLKLLEANRNNIRERTTRGRIINDSTKSRTSESSSRTGNLKARIGADYTTVKEEEKVGSLPQQVKNQYKNEKEFQNSRHSEVDNSAVKSRYEINTRTRGQDSSNSAFEGRSRKLSTHNPDEEKLLNAGREVSELSRSRSSDFKNFRSRSRTENLRKSLKSASPKEPIPVTEATLLLEPSLQTITDEKPLANPLAESKNEITVASSKEGIVSSTLKPLPRSQNRKAITNRGRGHVKGPKLLQENDNSGEVSDDDNYPEVYKKLKKSGTDPKEILALLKARKAARDKLESSKSQITQLDASSKPSQREVSYNDEGTKQPRGEDQKPLHSRSRTNLKTYKTDAPDNQRLKSKEANSNNYEQSDQAIKIRSTVRDLQSRNRNSSLRNRSELNRKQENSNRNDDVESSKDTHKKEKLNKERKYTQYKRTSSTESKTKSVGSSTTEKVDDNQNIKVQKEEEYQTEQRKKLEGLNDEQNVLDAPKHFAKGTSQFKTFRKKEEISPSTDTVEASPERGNLRPTYVPRNREKDKEKFKARTEKNTESFTTPPPIKPKYSLYNRSNRPTFTKRTFTTAPTSEGDDLSTPKEKNTSFFQSRNRPPFVPSSKVDIKQASSSFSLHRYKQRKAALQKLEVLKDDDDDDDEDLIPHFNGLSVDSLVSESEHSSVTTEGITGKRTTKRRSNYRESFIQRIPPKKKGGYTRTPSIFTTTEDPSSTSPFTTLLPTSNLFTSDNEEQSELPPTLLYPFTSGFEKDELNYFTTTLESITESVTLPLTTTITPSATFAPNAQDIITTDTPTTTTMEVNIPSYQKEESVIQNNKHATLDTTTTTPATRREPTTTSTKIVSITVTNPTTISISTTTTAPTLAMTNPTPTTMAPRLPTTNPTTITTTPATTTTTSSPSTTYPPSTSAPVKTTTTITNRTTPTSKSTTKQTPPKTKSTTKRTSPTINNTTKRTTSTTTHVTTTKKMTTIPTTIKPSKISRTTKKTTTKHPRTTIKRLGTTKASTTTKKQNIATLQQMPSTSATSPPPNTSTFKIDKIESILSTKHPNFLSTVAYLAKNLSVTATDYDFVNTANIRSTKSMTENTTPINIPDNYVVYGLLPNNNVVRKVVKTTKAPIDIPFIIYGLYPNGTIVRRFPNGTIIPEETEEENEIIGSVEPGSHEDLENVVKKDSPLSYLYPPGSGKQSEQTSNTAEFDTEYNSFKAATTTQQTKSIDNFKEVSAKATPSSFSQSTAQVPTTEPTLTMSTSKILDARSTSKIPFSTTEKHSINITSKKPAITTTTNKPIATTTKKLVTTMTTTKPLSSMVKKPTTVTTKKAASTTTIKTAKPTTKKPTSASTKTITTTKNPTTTTTTTTKRTTSSTTKNPTTTTTKRTTSSTTKKTTNTLPTTKKSSKVLTSIYTQTTPNPTISATKLTSRLTSTTMMTSRPATTKNTKKPDTTTKTLLTTTIKPITTTSKPITLKQQPTTSKHLSGLHKSSSTTNVTKTTTKSMIKTTKIEPKDKSLGKDAATKATTPLSDLELLNNLLSQATDNKVPTGTTESSDVLANKVIQLAIERAQKSTATPRIMTYSSPSDLQSLSSTASPVVNEEVGTNSANKSGKISVWVIPPEEEKSVTPNPLGNTISPSDAALLQTLLSTPNTLDKLSLSDQIHLADALSSTAFPQTTVKKKKKKKPKITTTTTQSPFPVLRYIFGRNRGGGGLFQRGLFRGGGLGAFGSTPQVEESPGGIFQNENGDLPQGQVESAGGSQDSQVGYGQQGPALVNAAINVSRAVSQFMGYVIQGAAQSFQNYLQSRTRALAEALAYPPSS